MYYKENLLIIHVIPLTIPSSFINKAKSYHRHLSVVALCFVNEIVREVIEQNNSQQMDHKKW